MVYLPLKLCYTIPEKSSYFNNNAYTTTKTKKNHLVFFSNSRFLCLLESLKIFECQPTTIFLYSLFCLKNLYLWECKLVQPLWKAVWRFLRKLKIDLPYDPAVALLGIYPRDTGVLMHRGTCTPMFIAALSTIAKLWKEPKCPSTDEWIKKLWFIYTMEYYVAMRKNEIWPFVATWMELESVMLSEISHTEKDRYHMFSLLCGS